MRCSLTTLPKEHLSIARSAKKGWLSFRQSLALAATLSTVLHRVPIEKTLQHLYHCPPKSPNRRCPRKRGKESRKYITKYITEICVYKPSFFIIHFSREVKNRPFHRFCRIHHAYIYQWTRSRSESVLGNYRPR